MVAQHGRADEHARQRSPTTRSASRAGRSGCRCAPTGASPPSRSRCPDAGGVLVKTLLLSLDPAMRGWMNEGKSYIAPVGDRRGDARRRHRRRWSPPRTRSSRSATTSAARSACRNTRSFDARQIARGELARIDLRARRADAVAERPRHARHDRATSACSTSASRSPARPSSSRARPAPSARRSASSRRSRAAARSASPAGRPSASGSSGSSASTPASTTRPAR